MSYEPTQWSAGDTVTSAKLNKMEQGITTASTGAIFNMTPVIANQYDAYWESEDNVEEIINTFLSGKNVIFHCEPMEGFTSSDIYLTMSAYASGYEPDSYIPNIEINSPRYGIRGRSDNNPVSDFNELNYTEIINNKLRIHLYVD